MFRTKPRVKNSQLKYFINKKLFLIKLKIVVSSEHFIVSKTGVQILSKSEILDLF